MANDDGSNMSIDPKCGIDCSDWTKHKRLNRA